VLEDIIQLSSPLDMLQCMLRCTQAIYRQASEYARLADPSAKMLALGADDFFPVWIYVIIHARVPDINSRLVMMQTYSDELMSERGYYLTCLEGAIGYILAVDSAKLDEFEPKE
jgi:hypothetical protein